MNMRRRDFVLSMGAAGSYFRPAARPRGGQKPGCCRAGPDYPIHLPDLFPFPPFCSRYGRATVETSTKWPCARARQEYCRD
jgi:hypothetical protein